MEITLTKRERLHPFTISLPGVEGAVRNGLAQTIEKLAPLKLSADDKGTVELVLAEALNNVIEHALAATQGTTLIEVTVRHDEKGLHLTITDEGVPMPTGQAPGAKAPDVDVDLADMPEGGFGWFMIHTLAEEVQYERIGDANHLRLMLSLDV